MGARDGFVDPNDPMNTPALPGSEIVSTLRVLGADEGECWKGLIAAGFTHAESLVAMHHGFDDPFLTLELVMELLTDRNPSNGFEDIAWVPSALKACAIHPISLRFWIHSNTNLERPDSSILHWLDDPIWEGATGTAHPVDPSRSNTFRGIRIPAAQDIALVMPEHLNLEECQFASELPPVYFRSLCVLGGSGLRHIPFLERRINLNHYSQNWLNLEQLPDLESLPDELSLPDTMLEVTTCPHLRLPATLEVRSLSLTDLHQLESLPRDLKTPRLDIKRCSFESLPCPAGIAEGEGGCELEVFNLSLQDLPRLKEVRIKVREGGYFQINNCPSMETAPLLPKKMKSVVVADWPGLISIPFIQTGLEGSLSLGRLPHLTTLPTRMRLKRLQLERLDSLTAFPDFTSTETLEIRDCPELREIPPYVRISHKLLFENLPNLESWPHGFSGGTVAFRNCPKLPPIPPSAEWEITQNGLDYHPFYMD